MNKERILIVGAGPVGLTLANLFLDYGINFQIIDKKDSISKRSKALAMHSRTLELFEQLNLSQKFIENGQEVTKANLFSDEQKIATVELSQIPSRYNFILSICQSETEKILEERLRARNQLVKWGCELAELKVVGAEKVVEINNKNQITEQQGFDYIFACDGAHSPTRKFMGIGFEGFSYQQGFLLADVEADSDFDRHSMNGFFKPKKVLFAIPLKSENSWRIITTIKNNEIANSTSPTLEDFKRLTDEVRPKDFLIRSASWISAFHVHHRIIDTYSKDNIFFLGDAAHVHSPIGGQGMNAGIHDAFYLADKMQKVLNGSEAVCTLDLYGKERRQVAQGILRGTDLATRLITNRSLLKHLMQKLVLKFLNRSKWLQKKLVCNLAMINKSRLAKNILSI